jgi:hypothetical protein
MRTNGSSNVGVSWRRLSLPQLPLTLPPADKLLLCPLSGPFIVQRIVHPDGSCCADGQDQDVAAGKALQQAGGTRVTCDGQARQCTERRLETPSQEQAFIGSKWFQAFRLLLEKAGSTACLGCTQLPSLVSAPARLAA